MENGAFCKNFTIRVKSNAPRSENRHLCRFSLSLDISSYHSGIGIEPVLTADEYLADLDITFCVYEHAVWTDLICAFGVVVDLEHC